MRWNENLNFWKSVNNEFETFFKMASLHMYSLSATGLRQIARLESSGMLTTLSWLIFTLNSRKILSRSASFYARNSILTPSHYSWCFWNDRKTPRTNDFTEISPKLLLRRLLQPQFFSLRGPKHLSKIQAEPVKSNFTKFLLSGTWKNVPFLKLLTFLVFHLTVDGFLVGSHPPPTSPYSPVNNSFTVSIPSHRLLHGIEVWNTYSHGNKY